MAAPPAPDPGSTRLVLDAQFQRTCERLRTPAWVFDNQVFRVIWGNSAAMWLWQRKSLSDLREMDMEATETSRTRVDALLARLLHGPEQVVSEQWTFYPNNVPLTTLCDMTVIYVGEPPGPDRPVLLIQAQTMDMTASHAHVDSLRNVEMMRHLPVIVAMYEIDSGALVFQNPKSTCVFGLDHHLYNLFVDAADVQSVRDAISQLGAYRGEVRVHAHGGVALHAMEISVSKDPISGNRLLLVYQVAMENFDFVRSLRKAQQEAIAANEAKTHFLSMVSHEIRTPLHGILGFAELLDATPLTNEQSSYVDMLRISGKALLSIINDILQLSRIEAGRFELHWTPIQLRELLDETVNIIVGAARDKKITISWSVDPTLENDFYSDAKHLKQILINLLGNGVKFTPQEGVVAVDVFELDVLRIRTLAEERDDTDPALAITPLSGLDQMTPSLIDEMLVVAEGLRGALITRSSFIIDQQEQPLQQVPPPEIKLLIFAVADTGIGIPNTTTLDTLCMPFKQIDSSTTRSYEGTGLGLTITKQLLEAMGGKLFLSSECNVGSTFYCVLPLIAAKTTNRSLFINSRTRNSSSASGPLNQSVEDVNADRAKRVAHDDERILLQARRAARLGAYSSSLTVSVASMSIVNKPDTPSAGTGTGTTGTSVTGAICDRALTPDSELMPMAAAAEGGSESQMTVTVAGNVIARSEWLGPSLAAPINSVLSTHSDWAQNQPTYAMPESAVPESAVPEPAVPESAVPVPAAPEPAAPESAVSKPIVSEPEDEPVATAVMTELPTAPVRVLPPQGDASVCRVLVAEDNPINQKLLGRMLTLLNCEFELANNGQEVVDILMARGPAQFDVIFMDVFMPVMDGIQATETLRAAFPDPAHRPLVVAMTANATEVNRTTCLNAGMDEFLTKPATIGDIKKVTECVRGRRFQIAENYPQIEQQ